MYYKKILQEILKGMETAVSSGVSCNHYIFRNTKPIDMKPFPTPVTDMILGKYTGYLKEFLEGNFSVGDFLLNPAADGVKVLRAEKIPLWGKIRADLEALSVDGMNPIKIDAYNGSGNAIMMVIPVEQKEEKKEIHILSYHRNVASMLAGKIVFAKTQGFPFMRKIMGGFDFPDITSITGDILVLSPQVDAIIYDGHCFVFNVGNFCRIFKYEDIVNQELTASEGTIKGLRFISDGEEFWKLIHGKISLKREMLKAVENGRLTRFKETAPSTILGKIKDYSTQLPNIEFDENGNIKITDKSCRDIVGIISDRIHIDLIFNELNGVEMDE